jgi:Flp pilus assembly protein TadD
VSPASKSTPIARPARLLAFAWAPIVVLVTVAAYFPALHGGLVWDDDGHVTKPALQSLHGLRRIWFEVGATQQYYPVLHSAFWIEHRIWGDATLGYHLINVLLHATAACLLVVLLRQVFSPVERGGSSPLWDAPLLAGLLFAVHPVGAESVAWISEQKNTLSTVFYLSAALSYLRFDNGRKWSWYLLASLLFALAALSKSVTVSLPAALLILFWWQRGRISWRGDVAPLLPWFIFGAAVGALTAWVEHRFIGAHGTDYALSGIDRCLLAGRIVWFYLGKLIWPASLTFIYPHWTINAASKGAYLYPIALLALMATLWAVRRRSRGPLAAMLFYVGSLFPALGFFDVYPFRYSYVADHFQYLASLGIIVLVAAGWGRWQGAQAAGNSGSLLSAPSIASVLVLGAFGVLTCRLSANYANADTLYRATLANNPDCWLAHNNLANDLMRSGQVDDAIYHYQQALRLDPAAPEADENLGIALGRAGRSAEAIDIFERALRLRPDYAEVHYNLGVVLAHVGRLPEAIEHYETALRLSPNHAEAENGLGTALARTGRIAEAIDHFERAVALQSDDASTYNNLGTALRMTGRYQAAIWNLERALSLDPNLAAAHYNLALALRAVGKPDAAADEMAEAMRLRPDMEAH